MGALLFCEDKIKKTELYKCSFLSGDAWIIEESNTESTAPIELETNSSIPKSSSLHTRTGTLCELVNGTQLIRVGSTSRLHFENNSTVNISRGSMLISFNENTEFEIKSELSYIKTQGRFTAIVECTSNGGFKFIPLEGKGKIIPQTGEQKDIYRGRLTMVLGSPSKLGNAYDIDLLLLLKSSRLINSFPTPLPTMKRISLAVYAQQLKLKGKFNALIGDAPTDDNLQMWAFGKEDSKE